MKEKEFCHECCVLISPYDPEQKVFRGKLYHGRCLKRVQHKATPPIQMEIVWNGEMSLTKIVL